MGGWSSGVSVGADVGGISNALIARRVYFFFLQPLNKGSRCYGYVHAPFSPLIYQFFTFEIVVLCDYIHITAKSLFSSSL